MKKNILAALTAGEGTDSQKNLMISVIWNKINWAWDNWDRELTQPYVFTDNGTKDRYAPPKFIEDWVENEVFEADGFNMELLKTLFGDDKNTQK